MLTDVSKKLNQREELFPQSFLFFLHLKSNVIKIVFEGYSQLFFVANRNGLTGITHD